MPPHFSAPLQAWIEARNRFHLSHAQVQMARDLGMNPKHLGKKANHKQERWKVPLPQFIEYLYRKRFGKERPNPVLSIEQIAKMARAKKAAKHTIKRAAIAAYQPLPDKTKADNGSSPGESGVAEGVNHE